MRGCAQAVQTLPLDCGRAAHKSQIFHNRFSLAKRCAEAGEFSGSERSRIGGCNSGEHRGAAGEDLLHAIEIDSGSLQEFVGGVFEIESKLIRFHKLAIGGKHGAIVLAV